MDWSCIKCGEQNKPAYNFCWKCGTAKDSIGLSKQLKPVKLEDFIAYVRPPEKGASLKSAAFLISAGLLYLLLGLVLPRLGICFALPLGIVILSLIYRARRRSRKYDTNSLYKLSVDKRPPVLYLRPFGADIDSESVSTNLTLEEQLIAALNEIGPTVTVGVPGEDLPGLGAIRFYFPHSEWQERVKALMSISQLVVIQAGFTEGVEWELATSLKLLNPKRVIISFLSWQATYPTRCQSNYEVFLMLAERVLGKKYGSFPTHIDDNYFMFFDDNWVPSLSRPRANFVNIKQKSITSALEPIFRNITAIK